MADGGDLAVYKPDHATTRDGSAIDGGEAPHAGRLIVNADDWGRDPRTTGRILDCALRGAVSSVSAMVFMEDSERAATLARERGIDYTTLRKWRLEYDNRGVEAWTKPSKLCEGNPRNCLPA